MSKEMILLGKILGEIYLLKNNGEDRFEQHIYGLLNGFEDAIQDELEFIGYISAKKVDVVMQILDECDRGERNFTGYYDIRDDLKKAGVDRADFIKIAERFIKIDGRFLSLLDRLNSNNSPTECHIRR
ncbi:MAG: hypothetical protein FWG01_00150 [Betaproteobacteria bacterium]|nr:hypothetical protein [Betaproteobacteria bacterium]